MLPPYPESKSRDSINACALAEVDPVPTVIYSGRSEVGETGFVWERLLEGPVEEPSPAPGEEEQPSPEYPWLMMSVRWVES
jgi:hypothetical protein